MILVSILFAGAAFSQSAGSVGGQIVDTNGAVIVGATVTAVSADGKEKQAVTNSRGEYSIAGLAPGKYTLKAIAPNFSIYENTDVAVTAGDRKELVVVLTVAGVNEAVDVSNADKVTTDTDNNANATVIKDKNLDALPDDPDELQAALQSMAGAAAGPNGGQIYIDGFTGGQLPRKDAIREIRTNRNPFSAEYDRLSFGRIEVLTKPGSDKWRGQAFGNFNDESLNSRNPFAPNRAPSRMRYFGGTISGPIQKRKLSFFLDISDRNSDNNAIINAEIVDPSFNITDYRQDVRVPTKRFSVAPRIDYAINAKNTLVARYTFRRTSGDNQGVGDTSLASRAYRTSSREHEVRLTETMIINPKTVNETRFEYSDSRREQRGDNTIPTVNVAGSFTGGGSQIGFSFNRNRTSEVSNITSTSFGKHSQHSVKFGIRMRHVSVDDRSENNYGGTFVFPGFLTTDPCDIDLDGVVSAIEQYRCNVNGAVGTRYDPTQLTINSGNPLANVEQYDAGLFLMDDWKISPSLLLSFGLRYENQTNINSKLNFAPRFGFAWSPGAGGAKDPKTIVRGGAGIFYDRFSENLTLQAKRFDGVNQLSLLVNAHDTDPVNRALAIFLLTQPVFTLGGVSNVPTVEQILQYLPNSNTVWQVASNLESPYTMQALLGVERQLPAKTTLAAYFVSSRILHELRSRNINAPICTSQGDCTNARRPQQTFGNIYEYESSAKTNQNQFIINFQSNISSKYSLFGNYRLGFANGNTDGAGSFPAYSYDLTGEYGRTSFDIRHSFTIAGSITMPWKITLNPFVIANSGRPFNITRGGRDKNGDGQFTERPTFAELHDRCDVLHLSAVFCNIDSKDPNAIIPRNYGQGPSYFSVNMHVSRNFGFGHSAKTPAGGLGASGTGGGGGFPDVGAGRRGTRARVKSPNSGSGSGGGDARKPYNLNIGVSFTNLLNNVNLGLPRRRLSSRRFGQSTTTSPQFGGFGSSGGTGSSNRRVELQLRFSW